MVGFRSLIVLHSLLITLTSFLMVPDGEGEMVWELEGGGGVKGGGK